MNRYFILASALVLTSAAWADAPKGLTMPLDWAGPDPDGDFKLCMAAASKPYSGTETHYVSVNGKSVAIVTRANTDMQSRIGSTATAKEVNRCMTQAGYAYLNFADTYQKVHRECQQAEDRKACIDSGMQQARERAAANVSR